jgi:ABC-2 type transport system ATP-binding protein
MRHIAVLLPIAVVLGGFFLYCEIEVVRRPARYLPKVVWALIVLVQIPLGGILYLVLGRGDRNAAAEAVPTDVEVLPIIEQRRPVVTSDRAIVRTRGLTKVFAGDVGLHGVDLVVPARGVYGLVGPNGAGKTTLLSLLAGLRRAGSGDILSEGRIVLCPDTPAFEPWLTAAETVRAYAGADFDATRHALATIGLSDAADRRVGGFSRGMTQRLGLAVALASGADVLLLDEPTSALDPQGRSEILDLIRALGRDRAIVFSSHILADVQRVADTVGVLRDGRLLYQGPVSDLLDRHTRPSWRLHLRSGADALATRLREQPWVADVQTQPQGLRVDTTSLHAGETLLPAEIAASGAELIALNPAGADLESVFLDLVEAA